VTFGQNGVSRGGTEAQPCRAAARRVFFRHKELVRRHDVCPGSRRPGSAMWAEPHSPCAARQRRPKHSLHRASWSTCNPSPYLSVVETMEVRVKRIIVLPVLLITTATVATVGPGGSAAFADNGLSALDAPAAMGVLAGAGPAAPAETGMPILAGQILRRRRALCDCGLVSG
jgi:hypothetical protein